MPQNIGQITALNPGVDLIRTDQCAVKFFDRLSVQRTPNDTTLRADQHWVSVGCVSDCIVHVQQISPLSPRRTRITPRLHWRRWRVSPPFCPDDGVERVVLQQSAPKTLFHLSIKPYFTSLFSPSFTLLSSLSLFHLVHRFPPSATLLSAMHFKYYNLDKQSVEVPGTRTPGATGKSHVLISLSLNALLRVHLTNPKVHVGHLRPATQQCVTLRAHLGLTTDSLISHNPLGHYRHAAYADSLVTNIREAPQLKTLYDVWQNCMY